MCVILYNTCETGHIESSVLLSLSASCFNSITDIRINLIIIDWTGFTSSQKPQHDGKI